MKTSNIIVVIATSLKRTDLMIERSLESVYAQIVIVPKCIYIVDDNEDEKEFFNVREKVKQFRKNYFEKNHGIKPDKLRQNHFHTKVIRNSRTKGRSGTGSWNTAAFHAFENYRVGYSTYLAILDDDDRWDPAYLYSCWLTVTNYNKLNKREFAAAIVSSFWRIEGTMKSEIIVKPSHLEIEQFLVKNPGWQGSNTFVELNTFWEAGGYDENMHSTNDRDFAIRFLEVCSYSTSARVLSIETPLMEHFVHDGQRVTTNKEGKRLGLDSFYQKHLFRMSKEQKEKSLRRAKELFDYDLFNTTESQSKQSMVDSQRSLGKLNLIVGLTTDNKKNLLDHLKSFIVQKDTYVDDLNQYHYVILENTDNPYEIRPIIKYIESEKLENISFFTIEDQKEIFKEYPFRHLFEDENIAKKSISFSRSLTQYLCRKKALEIFNDDCITLIVDDDLMFELLITNADGQITTTSPNYFKKILELKMDTDADIIISTCSDAPPLPFFSSIKTQILDLYYNLNRFASLNPEKAFQSYSKLNRSLFSKEDFYYDLSSQKYSHLEQPFWWTKIDEDDNNLLTSKAFEHFVQDSVLLRNETNVFRPLTISIEEWNKSDYKESIHRGGITFFMKPNLLDVIPNFSPEILVGDKQRKIRRSDFNFCVYLKHECQAKIYQAKIPMLHKRRLQDNTFNIDTDKLLIDIIGLSFYRSYEKQLLLKAESNIDEDKQAHKIFCKKTEETLTKLKINNRRLLRLLYRCAAILNDHANWWYKTEYREDLNDHIQELIFVIEHLKFQFSRRRFQSKIKAIETYMQKLDFKEALEVMNNLNVRM